MNSQGITPFLKWAGGKRWLAAQLRAILPNSFQTYIEPFLGSGAVFFDLLPQTAILSDLNRGLIEAYRAIQTNAGDVYEALTRHAVRHSRAYYYEVRGREPSGAIERAARFIYLNRTCWNALYRENKRGEFNVPIGTKERVLLETDDFLSVSRALATAELICDDFEVAIDRAEANDLIYVDPPYTTAHNFNGFVRYNNVYFEWADQERLKRSLKRAAERGAYIVISNADHCSVRELYTGLAEIRSVSRRTVIAADPSRRCKTSELLMVINGTP